MFRANYNPSYYPSPLPPPTQLYPYSEFHSSFLSHLVFLRSVSRLLVTASVVPNSPILVTLMNEALQEPHGMTYQKTPFFIVTAVKTSNLHKHSSNDSLVIATKLKVRKKYTMAMSISGILQTIILKQMLHIFEDA
jgi:hypothetical protein